MNDSPSTATDSTVPPEASEDRDAALHETLAEVCHDLNNSLSVVSGNAQLLAEMARVEDLGATFTEPLDDIEAARAEISDALERLEALRQDIDQGIVGRESSDEP